MILKFIAWIIRRSRNVQFQLIGCSIYGALSIFGFAGLIGIFLKLRKGIDPSFVPKLLRRVRWFTLGISSILYGLSVLPAIYMSHRHFWLWWFIPNTGILILYGLWKEIKWQPKKK